MRSFRLKNISKNYKLLLILMVVVAGMGEVKGQKYATIASIGGDAVSTNFTNAQGTSSTPPTGSNASYTVTAGLITKTGYLQLQFPSTIPLNTTVFIRFSGLVNGTTTAEAHKSSGKATGSNFYQVSGVDGNTYFAVTATEAFDRVRIITSANGGLGSITASANIFYAYYNESNTADCGIGTAVTTASTGLIITPPLPSNPLNAIDNDPDSFTFLTLGTIALTATVTEDIYFSGPSDEVVKVTFSIPATLLSLSLVNNINVQTFNGSTPTGAPQTLSSLLGLDALNLVSLLGSNNRYTFYFKPGAAFDRIEFVVGGLVSVAGGVNLYNVQRIPVKPTFNPASSQNVTSCSGAPVALTPVPISGSTFKWYDAGGTLLATGNSYTPSPVSTTTYYVATLKTVCSAESERIPVVVTINPLPVAPAGTAATICAGSNGVFQVTAPNSSYTYLWYTAATGGSPILTGTNVTTATAVTGSTTYYLEAVITATGCASATRTAVPITVNPQPTAAAGTAAAICSGSKGVFQVTAPDANYTYRWYTTATGGSPILTGTTVTTAPSLTSSTTYYLETVITTTGCASATRTSVPITVNPLPTAPAGTAPSVCIYNKGIFQVTSPDPAYTYNWYAAAVGGTPVLTGTTVTTASTLTLGLTYYLEAVVTATGCTSSSRTPVNIALNTLPPIPSGTASPICAGSIGVFQVNSPNSAYTYKWYTTGGALVSTGETLTTLSPLTTNLTYYLEAVNATTGCVSVIKTGVNLTVNPLPVPAGTAATICSGTNAVFKVTLPNALYTYNWYAAATGGSPVLTGSTVTTPTPLTSNLTYYLEAISVAGCVSLTRTAVTVTVSTIPAAPLGTAATICSGVKGIFSVNSADPTYTYNWYAAASGGSPVLTGSTVTTASTLTTGLTYYLEAVNPTGCKSTSRTAVTIIVNPLPQLSSSLTPSVCSNSALSYTAISSVSGTSFSWTRATVPGISNAVGSGLTNTITETLINTTNAPVTVTYVFNLNGNGCSNTVNVQLKVNPKPGPPHIVSQ